MTTAEDDDPHARRRSGGWRAGAFTAIVGAVVGSLAPLIITWWGYEHDTDMANRHLEEQAYADSLETTKQLEYRIRIQGQKLEDLDRDASSPTLGDAAGSIERIRVYGRPEVINAAGQMMTKLGYATEKGGEYRWREYDGARARYIDEIRDALEVPQ